MNGMEFFGQMILAIGGGIVLGWLCLLLLSVVGSWFAMIFGVIGDWFDGLMERRGER